VLTAARIIMSLRSADITLPYEKARYSYQFANKEMNMWVVGVCGTHGGAAGAALPSGRRLRRVLYLVVSSVPASDIDVSAVQSYFSANLIIWTYLILLLWVKCVLDCWDSTLLLGNYSFLLIWDFYLLENLN
jgi:hypothetical protein